MTHRVGPKGQVVIPKAMRVSIDLQPGDEVEFELVGESVRISPARARLTLRGALAGHDLVGVLEADRRAELR